MLNSNPENYLMNKERHQGSEKGKQEQEKLFEAAYLKAVDLLSGERIDMDKFKDLYGDKIITKDMNEVKKMQDRYEKTDTPERKKMQKYAVVFEAIVHDMIDMNGWLGDNAMAKKASLYDDLKNGVDEIIKFTEPKTSATSYLALGVDVTFGNDIIKKMDRIKTQIEKGDMGVIKYLLTNNYRGEMRNVPRVVIGADMKNLEEITKLWLDGKRRALAQHQVKLIILDQMIIQLMNFSRYAENVGQHLIADSFNRVLKIVEKIYDKESEEEKNINFNQDRVNQAIDKYCEDLEKENLKLETKK